LEKYYVDFKTTNALATNCR